MSLPVTAVVPPLQQRPTRVGQVVARVPDDAVVVGEVRRRRGHAPGLEILRRRDGDLRVDHECAGHQRGVLDLSVSQRDVEALRDEVDVGVRPDHVEAHLGVGLQELGDPLSERRRGHARRDQDSQQPTRHIVDALHGCFSDPDRIHHAPRPFVEELALLGELHAPGGAMQQPNPESLLEPSQPLAHRGPRQTQCLRRCGDAAVVDDRHELLETGRKHS